MRLLTKGRPRLRRDICNQYKLKHIHDETDEDLNLCYKVEDGNPVMLLLYVDDLFVKGMDELIVDTKRKLTAKFEMKDLGMMHYFLGMEIWQSADGISLGQGKYAVEILKKVWDDGLQGYGHTYGNEPEAIK